MSRLSASVAIALALAVTPATRAQTCALVQDLNTSGRVGISADIAAQRAAAPGNRFAAGFARIGNEWFFRATTIQHGEELWKTDGTAAGTMRISDIAPGALDADIDQITVADLGAGPRLWFRANDGTTGTELWTSDGTLAGTRRVADIRPGTDSSNPLYMIALGNRLLFSANNGTSGTELWMTDGTTAGTVELRDIRFGSLSSSPSSLLTDTAGTTCYFRANDGTHGSELWKTDGTTAGTVLVRDLNIGSSSSSPNYLINHNGAVLFVATAPNGSELWRTDGTRSGTLVVRDIYPGSGSASPNLFHTAVIGRDLFFRANNGTQGTELWKTDGTPNGTMLVSDIRVGPSGSSPTHLVAVGSRLFFAANEGYGTEPFMYDGTFVYSLGDLRPGTASSSPMYFTALPNGDVLFAATDGTTFGSTGTELWKTRGTTATTTRVADIRTGTDSSAPSALTLIDSTRIMMSAETTEHGRELWVSGGAAANTALLADVEPAGRTASSFPQWDVRQSISGSTLYFQAEDGTSDVELWRLRNGTAQRIHDINPVGDSDPTGFTEFFDGNQTLVVFAADDGRNGEEPWVTDGTTAGTRLLLDIQSRGGSFPDEFTAYDNRVFFSAASPAGVELFVTDGTPTGTRLFMDIRPGTFGSSPSDLFVFQNRLYFAASDGSTGSELWVSDGTIAGTQRVADIAPGTRGSSPDTFTEHNGLLYFRAYTTTNGSELWVTDGTTTGTRMVADVYPRSSSSNPRHLTSCGNSLFFTATDGTHGYELWKTDGTTAGTMLVRDIYTGSSSATPADLICSGDTLYFGAYSGFLNGGHGREIWKSDGTTAGTVEVADIVAGGSSGGFDYPVAAGGGGVYFTANHPLTGTELYFSDGTATGTGIVCEISPGTASSSPRHTTCIDGQIVFRATSPTTGTELYQLPAPPRANTMSYGMPCGPGAGRLEATDPVLGSMSRLTGTAPRTVPGIVMLGFPIDGRPLFASAPCATYINFSWPMVNVAAITSPTWSSNLPIPRDAQLRGRHVTVQAFFVYGTPIMAGTSNAVRLVLGE